MRERVFNLREKVSLGLSAVAFVASASLAGTGDTAAQMVGNDSQDRAQQEIEDQFEKLQWFPEAIGLDELRRAQKEGRISSLDGEVNTIRVGFIDTNYRAHQQVNDPQEIITLNGDGDSNHALHVVGLLSSPIDPYGIAGICPDTCEVTVIDVGGEDVTASWEAAAEGFRVAKEKGLDLVNCSFTGYDPPDTFIAALQEYLESGGMVIAAAGNSGPADPIGHPAAHPGVFVIGATNRIGNRSLLTNSFTPDQMDNGLMVPGEDIYVPTITPEGLHSYVLTKGTSYSTAIATGTLATLMSYGVPGDIGIEYMLNTAQDMEASGTDIKTGRGRLDIFNALSALNQAGFISYEPPYQLLIPNLNQ